MNPNPKTDADYEKLLESVHCEVIDHDVDSFSVRNMERGGQTHLEAADYSSALVEAWALMKP